MKYYIIAGEASGDLHASNLMRELKLRDKDAEFRCWGGDLMQEQGGEIIKHYRELAFMGFLEVIKNLPTILKNISQCKKDILSYKPDVLILVDYPGFNLRIASFAKARGLKVFYYISPSVWAWKESRVYSIKKSVDRMFVILPFEKEFYKKFDYDVDFVGNPLVDAVERKRKLIPEKSTRLKKNNLSDKLIVAILPGSRKQEIAKILPTMLSVQKYFESYQFVVAGAPSIQKAFYDEVIPENSATILYAQSYDILQHATAAIVASGTATLETALFEVPQIVCYKANPISVFIGRMLIKVKFISLVNLILDKEVVQELIQNDFNTENIKNELNKILNEETYRNKMKSNYFELKTKLGGIGASANAAELMINYLNPKSYI